MKQATTSLPKRPQIFAVIPTYNEEKRINKTIKQVEKFVDQVVIIDDGSEDQTAQKIKSSKAILLQHPNNLGQGAALQTGIDYATQHGADFVVTFDSDGQFQASQIPQLIKPLLQNQADVALGSRFLGKTINLPLAKLITLKLGVLFTRIFSEINLTDTHNGFRALGPAALKKIKITHNRMAHASEIIDQIKTHQLRFIEVPVTIKYDRYSKKKGQGIFNAFYILADLIFDRLTLH